MVDRTREKFLAEGQNFYMKRLKKYAQVEWVETKPVRINKNRTTPEVLSLEGDAILKRIHSGDHVIALDRKGKAFTSRQLATRMEKIPLIASRITFIIGGPLGLAEKVLEKADETLSLSKMTFTHEMSRVLLMEQLYRAFSIINNEKYHK